MANKKAPNSGEQAQSTHQDDGSLDPRAIQTLLEGIDLASRRGAFSIQEAGKFAEAYMHTANVLTSVSKAMQENAASMPQSTMNQNINGDNS